MLLVDDHADTREMYAEFLVAMGLETRQATTCAMALEAVASDAIDAIVLDRRLPDGDGASVSRTLRGDPRTHTLPIVVISGTTNDGSVIADAYLLKPVIPEALFAAVAGLLGLKPGG